MFSRLTIVRLKAAENALKDGRIDEAFRLATAEDLRDHRRAKKVLTKVAAKLLERARSHYDAGLYAEAISDLHRAAAANVNLTEITALREEITEAARQSQYRHQRRQHRLDDARQRIEAGSVAAGERLLGVTQTEDPRSRELKKLAEANAKQARTELEQAAKMLKRGQIAAAVDRVLRAEKLNAQDPGVAETEALLTGRVIDAARDALKGGRTDRARNELAVLGRLGRNDPRRHELERNLELIGRVARAAAAAQYDEALRFLRQLRHLLPDIKWIKEAEDQVSKLRETRMALLSGPLGMGLESLSAGGAGRTIAIRGGANADERGTPVRPNLNQATDEWLAPGAGAVGLGPDLPSRILMLIDGVGSFLILTQPRVSIGRLNASSNDNDAVADIALMADISRHHADVARIEDDYFLFPHRKVQVDGREGGQRLLCDRNRIGLSRLARVTFRLPNPKSSTAVLDLSSGVRMSQGVRHVLLFDELAVFGRGRRCHIQIPSARNDLILYHQKGKLYLRSQPSRPEDRFNGHNKYEIRLGQPLTVDEIGFCFQPWPDEAGPSTTTA